MKHKKVFFAIVVFVLLILFSFVRIYVSFSRDGLDTGIFGVLPGDELPANDGEIREEVSLLDYRVLESKHLFFSKVYLIERAGYYQIRFRVAYAVPFMHGNIMWDMKLRIEDSQGNNYLNHVETMIYPARIGGLNCVNITLVLDGQTYDALLGDKITFSAFFLEDEDSDREDAYAQCKTEMSFEE